MEESNNELVAIEEFIKQVQDIEGVEIKLTKNDSADTNRLVKPYNYERLPDTATVDDLKARINECINKPFIHFINI